MKKFYVLVLVLSLCIIEAKSDITWNPANGPYGGTINVMLENGLNTIFAGTTAGLYRSTDNGSSWSIVSGISEDIIDINSDGNGSIWVASMGNMYHTTDNGLTWNTANGNLGPVNYKAAAISSDGTIFTLTHISHNWNKIKCSKDNGTTWMSIETPIQLIQKIYMSRQNNILYIGTYKDGIYKSEDLGQTIVKCGLDTMSLRSIFVSDNGDVFAGTDKQGVYKSTNNGSTWTYAGLDGETIYSIFVDSQGNYYAGTYNNGVFKSTNNGSTWAALTFQK